MLRYLVLNHCWTTRIDGDTKEKLFFFWAGDTVECSRNEGNTLFFDDGKGGEYPLVFPDECLRPLTV